MKIYQYMAASALLLAVAACSNDDGLSVPSYDTNPNAVRIQPSVSGIVVTRTSPADDSNSTTFSKDDGIMVSRDGKDFYQYDYNGTSWSPAPGSTSYLMWGADETTIDLQAFYTVSASMTSFTLPLNQDGVAGSGTNEIADADYMTFSGTVTKGTDNTASFAMQRRTARVCVTIDGFGDQYATTSTCDVKIYSPYTTVSVDYSGTEPAVTGTGNAQPVTPLNGKGMVTGDKATALVVPSSAAISDANFMAVTVNDETEPLYVKGIPVHQAGYSYDYHLTVGKDGIVINSVQVNPWNDPIDVEGGTAEEKTAGPDADSNTIKTSKAGQIASNSEWIETAINGGTSLTVSGPMNAEDIAALKNYLKDNSGMTLNLNLAGAELTVLPGTDIYSDKSEWPGLVSIVLPEGLTTISSAAFYNCADLTSATLPSTLETIEGSAFAYCTGLMEVTLPSSLKTLEYSAFFDCSGLTKIDLSHTQVEAIDNSTFKGCTKLEEVVLNNGVKTIGDASFGECNALKTIDLSQCDQIPTAGYVGEQYTFDGVSSEVKKAIIVYVKNEDLKSEFASSYLVTREGLVADNCQVKE